MKTKKRLRKSVVRTIKAFLATVLLLTCIQYFPTVTSAEGEGNTEQESYGSTEILNETSSNDDTSSQEGTTLTVEQPQQEEPTGEQSQEEQKDGKRTKD